MVKKYKILTFQLVFIIFDSMPRDINYLTSDKNIINITTYGENTGDNPAVVVVHGFKGFKDWGFFPYAAEHFKSLGFFVVTFNFSHNGIGNIKDEFSETDKFAENTYSREVDELIEITKKLKEGFFADVVPKKVGILGHSRGGGISILASDIIKPDCLVTWSSVATLDRYTEHQKKEWRKNGFYSVKNSRTGQEFKMNLSFLEDIENNINGRLNIEKAVKNLNLPYLVIHGSEDLTVKKDEAESIYQWSDKKITELKLIENAGHTFNCVHPFAGSNKNFESVLKLSGEFLKNNLELS